jgi:hypothetical protein
MAPWPYYWPPFYASTLLLNSALTFTPLCRSLCASAGFPQPPARPLNVYVYLFAGTQFMIGSSVAVLCWLGEWRAVSVIVVSATPMGILGTGLSASDMGEGRYGKAFWTHVGLLSVGTLASWALVRREF